MPTLGPGPVVEVEVEVLQRGVLVDHDINGGEIQQPKTVVQVAVQPVFVSRPTWSSPSYSIEVFKFVSMTVD